MTLKDLRKSKKMTIGKLAELSGVSAKTVSDLEKDPSRKTRDKTLGKMAEALGISAHKLTDLVYSSEKKRVKGDAGASGEENIVLDDVHVNRILRLIDNELDENRNTLMEGMELVDDYPAMAKLMNMLTEDVDLLLNIKGLLQS
jgi:transcriptional regulator with XRE-family HTH domain